jgi:hypothetical protein
MRCLHCGNRVPLLRRAADGDFCCEAHRKRHFEITRRGLSRLLDVRPDGGEGVPAAEAHPTVFGPKLTDSQPHVVQAEEPPPPKAPAIQPLIKAEPVLRAQPVIPAQGTRTLIARAQPIDPCSFGLSAPRMSFLEAQFEDQLAEPIPDSASAAKRGLKPKLTLGEAEFGLAASAAFPILSIRGAAQPESLRLPKPRFRTLDPLAARPGEAQPSNGFAPVNLLGAKELFGSQGREILQASETLARPGSCFTETPAAREIAAVALKAPAGDDSIGFVPTLVYPVSAPAKPRATLRLGGHFWIWLHRIDTDFETKSTPAGVAFELAFAATVPALSLQEAAQPEPPRLPKSTFCTLDPLAANPGETQPAQDLAQVNLLATEPVFGSRGSEIPHASLARPGFCHTEMPAGREMAAIALRAPAGDDSIGLVPELVYPMSVPGNSRATLPPGDPVKLWVTPVDDDDCPVTGVVWFEQEVSVALPAISIADPGMTVCGPLCSFRPACFLELRDLKPVGGFEAEWPVSSPLLPSGDSLPVITLIRL